jgi:hypothetical protein
MANITTTQVSSAIPTIVAAKTLGRLKANLVLANIINRDYDNEVAVNGQTVNVQVRGALSVNDKAANTVVTLQTPSTSSLPVTLNKHKEVSFLAEDLAIMFARPNLIDGYAEDAAIAIAEQVETDIAALYSGFSQTLSALTGLAEGTFREGQRLLNAAKAPQSQRYAVLHEDAYKEAGGIEKLINRDYQGDAAMEAIKNGYLGMLSGFNVQLSQQIATASSQCKNLFLHRNAAVLATRPLRKTAPGRGVEQVTMNMNDLGLRVTMSYSHDYLGEKMTIDFLYGVAELRDSHGITVSTTEV